MERSGRTASTQQRLGDRFVLGEEVGRGGMAVVHRAHDEVLDREVAVKLLLPHLATDDAFLARFRREARAAGALSHPNIVAVHDWGEDEDRAFLVLQLVEGASLRDVLRNRGRLRPAEAMAVLVPAAAGLQAAHDAGLVHRDVKPENLLIGTDGSVRVTDFGLARAAAEATTTFGPDVLVGSPHYLAPEAVRGGALGPRADVYALGVLLYECLVGQPPHTADTPYSIALAHVEREVPLPSARLDGLPPALDDVVRDATRREVSARTASAAAFATALRAAVDDEDGASAPPSLHAVTRSGPPHPPLHPDRPTPPIGTAQGRPAPGQTLVVPLDDVHTEVVAASATHGAPERPEQVTPPQERAATPRRRRARWPLVVLLLALLIGGSAAGGYLLWDRVLAPVTPIPSVIGAPADSGTEQLERAGFVPEVDATPVHDRAVPADHVLAQDPVGEARAGTEVSLVLSAGPRQVAVPDVVGAGAPEAVAALEEADLSATERTTHDASVPEGAVIATDPAPGSTVDEGSEIVVTVSLGPTPISVPELTGTTLSSARSALAELDLELVVAERRFDDDADRDRILAQEPGPEAVLFAGDAVEVVVSDGPRPVELPNVRGERVADAVATLEALGFEVEVERRGGFSAFLNPDRVYDQDPGPGSRRVPGAAVQLYAYEP